MELKEIEKIKTRADELNAAAATGYGTMNNIQRMKIADELGTLNAKILLASQEANHDH